ncbi:MAG: hypothetical protein ACOZF2_12215 [Thermodesulfobacteriota bacterium]
MQTTTGKIFGAGLIIAVMLLAAFTPDGYAAKKVKKKKRGVRLGELYIQQGKKKIKLTQRGLTFRTAILMGEDVRSGVYGLAKAPTLKADTHPLEIMVFDPESAGEKVRLTRLAYVEKDPASIFDLNPTKLDPENFAKTYGLEYNAEVPINLWCVAEYIPLQITEVPKKPGWFCLVPTKELTPGNYAINHGGLEGPRLYTGEHPFYPLVLVTPPPPPPPKPKVVRKKVRRKAAKPKEEVAVAPPCPPAPPPPLEVAPPVLPPPPLDAGFTYYGVYPGAPKIRREYQITNLNDYPWHNVRIKIYVRDGKTILGPVTQDKNIVLPDHTVNQRPDKTMMHYETLNDEGFKIYLEISAKEGNLKRAWHNYPADEPGVSNLVEIPWDLD